MAKTLADKQQAYIAKKKPQDNENTSKRSGLERRTDC